MADVLLELTDLRAGYGEAVVLDGISISIAEGAGLALLGRNGVGKTTLIQTIMGFTYQLAGSIKWRGEEISKLKPHMRARRGLGWVPQEREIFPTLSVEENLTVVGTPGPWDMNKVYELFPRLKERRANMGNQLSGGEQQMLAIGRALMTNPAMLLLDEPLEGLAPIIVEELSAAIGRMVSESGMTIILVEQHAEATLEMTDEAVILERGQVVHRAQSKDLLADQATLDRYIGLNIGD